MTDHHEWGPSAMYYKLLCRGFTSDGAEGSAAKYGHDMHRRIDEGDFEGLTSYDAAALEWCIERTNAVLADQFKGPPEISESEVRIDILDPRGNVICFGTADRAYAEEKTGLIVDYKFGRFPVSDLIQLELYALGWIQKHDLEECFIFLLQPFPNKTSAIRLITRDHMDGIFHRWFRIKQESEKTSLNLSPSEKACQYCQHAPLCPAYDRLVKSGIALADRKQLTGPEASRELDRMAILTKWVKAKRAWLKREIEDGLEAPGYELREKAGKRSVVDVKGLYKAISGVLDPTAVSNVSTISASQLEKAFASRWVEIHEDATLQEGEDEFRRRTNECIDRKPPTWELTKLS